MNMVLFVGTLFALNGLYVLLGWWFTKERMTSADDYFLANRTLGVFSIAATLLATQIGGGFFSGTTADPVNGLMYCIGMCAGLLLLGSGIAAKLRSFNVSTVAEIFETHYNSVLLRRIDRKS